MTEAHSRPWFAVLLTLLIMSANTWATSLEQAQQAYAQGELGKARTLLQELAQTQDSKDAMHYLGLMMLRGEGGPEDIGAGLQWIDKAADAGHIDSLLLLADLAVDQDPPAWQQACLWFDHAAKLGAPQGMMGIAVCHLTGEGAPAVKEDPIRSLAWFLAAEQAGVEKASEFVRDIQSVLPEPHIAQAQVLAAELQAPSPSQRAGLGSHDGLSFEANTPHHPDAYTETDVLEDWDTWIAGGPLFIGPLKTLNPAEADYQQLRLDRVNEILERMSRLSEGLDTVVAKAVDIDASGLEVLMSLTHELGDDPASSVMDRAAKASIDLMAQTASQLHLLRNLPLSDTPVTQWPLDPVASSQAYSRWVMQLALMMQVGEHIIQQVSREAALQNYAESKPHLKRLAHVLQVLAEPREARYALLLGQYHDLLTLQEEIVAGLYSLQQANELRLLDTLQHARSMLPHWRKQSRGLAPRPGFDADAIALLSMYDESLAELLDGLTPHATFLQQRHPAQAKLQDWLLISSAWAAESWWNRAVGQLTSPLKRAASATSGLAWGAGKCVVSPIKCMKKAHRNVTNATGAVLEVGGNLGKMAVSMSADMLYGPDVEVDEKTGKIRQLSTRQRLWSSFGQRLKEFAEDDNKMKAAYAEGKAGSRLLRAAGKQLEGVDEFFGQTFGDKSTRLGWVTGGIARVTSGMVTGMGRTVLTIADPDASASQLALAGLDLALNSIGGSTSVLKSSQVAKIGMKRGNKLVSAAQKVGRKSLQRVQGAKTLSQQTAIRGRLSVLFKGKADDVLGRVAERQAKHYQALARAETKSMTQLYKNSGKVVTDLKHSMIQNLEQAPKAAKEYFEKRFENRVTGVLDSILNITTGKGRDLIQKEGYLQFAKQAGSGYLDNLVAAVVDNQVKEMMFGDGSDTDKPVLASTAPIKPAAAHMSERLLASAPQTRPAPVVQKTQPKAVAKTPKTVQKPAANQNKTSRMLRFKAAAIDRKDSENPDCPNQSLVSLSFEAPQKGGNISQFVMSRSIQTNQGVHILGTLGDSEVGIPLCELVEETGRLISGRYPGSNGRLNLVVELRSQENRVRKVELFGQISASGQSTIKLRDNQATRKVWPFPLKHSLK